ncbi:hypothetical protein [Ensifer sp. LBL]|uniref:hypothetical protein n=1 Tax=Ensifer sp. LBL TaxID=2991056 RepID=UPI003D217D6F
MDIRKHWDRWIWLIPAAVIVIVWLRLLFAERPFCSADPNENCFREWISALGGWVAIFVAVPTIAYLAKQVGDAERFSRANVRLQTLPALEHAKHVKSLATKLKRALEESIDRLPTIPSSDIVRDVKSVASRITVIRTILDREEFKKANLDFQTSFNASMFIDDFNSMITDAEGKIKSGFSETYLTALTDTVKGHYETAILFCDAIIDQSTLRISLTEAIISAT